MAIKPEDFLKSSLGKPVLIILKNGEELKGTLRDYDESINLTIENAEKTGESKKIEFFVVKGSKISLIASQ